MKVSDTSQIVVTFKGGAGYEAPWIVIHADSVDDLTQKMLDIEQSGITVAVKGLAESFRATMVTPAGSPASTVEAVLGGQEIVAPAANGLPVVPGPGAPAGTGVGNYPAPPSVSPQIPASLAPTCPDCGAATVYKQDTSQNPPKWKGWFCQAAPRGVKHGVTWVK
jgi:hypothetical protein